MDFTTFRGRDEGRYRSIYNLSVLSSLNTSTRLDPRALVLALVVGAFVSLYPQLDAMGYCDEGGCPEASQSSGISGNAMGGGASHVGTGGGSVSGVGHASEAQAGVAGMAPLAVLAAAPAHLFSRLFVVLKAPPGPLRPASLSLPPDSPPPILSS